MAAYFTEDHEKMVLAYNAETDDIKKNELFNKLYPALAKLAECVYRRYTFNYLTTEMGDDKAIQQLLSHLVQITPKFTQGRGKAFSYYTYCGRNYCIQQNNEAYARHLKLTPIVLEHEDEPEFTHQFVPRNMQVNDKIHEFNWEEFMQMCAVYWEKRRKTICTKPLHHLILNSMIEMMKNPSDIEYSAGLNCVGKKSILARLRQETGTSSQRIRPFLERMKEIQSKLLKEYETHGTVGDIMAQDN